MKRVIGIIYCLTMKEGYKEKDLKNFLKKLKKLKDESKYIQVELI